MYSLPSGGSILVYQPQIASWDKQTRMVAFSAVSYRSKAGDKPALGTIKLEADTKVAVPDRLVSFQKMKIAEANFQTLPKEQIREITDTIDKAIPDDERVIALDRVLANVDKSQIVPEERRGHQGRSAADLLQQDARGDRQPRRRADLEPDQGERPEVRRQHELGSVPARARPTPTTCATTTRWLKATDVKGPWAPAGTLPDSFKKLPAEDNWKDVKANLPGKPLTASAVPKVFVSLQPAELILLTGEPSYLLVAGHGAAVGEQHRERRLPDGQDRGRSTTWWPAAGSRRRTSPDRGRLPRRRCRRTSRRSRSSTTARACWRRSRAPIRPLEAVLLAQMPQTARVNKKETKAPDVAFQGDPAVRADRARRRCERAVNTDKDVFKVGDLYYMCYQGVWFVGKSATGPWEVASSVPAGDLPDPGQLAVASRDLRHDRRRR